jgi:alpha-beta hydrolase superfamily lysophospholipase
VTTAAFDGYVELFLEAHLNTPPDRLFRAAAGWLDRLTPERRPGAGAAPLPPPPAARLETPDWTELPVAFGDGLRGVLCLPTRPGSGEGVIFGNTGGDPRAGIGGFAARACRALASRGVSALRFDFAGLGESAGDGARRSHVYEDSRTADLVAAAELMAAHGCADPVLTGVCAGGYQALRAAIEDRRFRRIVMINSWLVWRPSEPLTLSRPIFPTRRRINVFALLRPSGWRRLLRGEVKAGEALATLFRRARRHLVPRRPDAAGQAARRDIARITADGAKILVVAGRDDESLDGVEAEFGRRGRWLARRPGVAVTTVARLDHGLFSLESQELALAELFRFLGL